MALSLLSNILTPSKDFTAALLRSARRFFGNDPSRMAIALSGTSDKKSREYKAQIRNIQRWYTTGKEKRLPGMDSLFKLARYASWWIHMTFFDEYDQRQRSARVFVSPQDSSKIRGSLLTGNTQRAISQVFDSWGYNPFDIGEASQVDIKDIVVAQ